MPTITVEPKLYERVEEAALERETSVGQILAQAIRRYLWEEDRHKISEESKVYRKNHAKLKKGYLGQFIAMHKGQVVDHDLDFHALRQPILQHFGRIPIMITKVEEQAERVFTRRGLLLKVES
jgi:hypothetical protein